MNTLVRTHGTGGATRVPDDVLPPGAKAGPWLVERELGRGGMGVVYAVVHEDIGKRAALKVIHEHLREHERMLVEARVVNRVGHPNIVDIFETGALPDGRPYIVMERLGGQSLAERASLGKILPLDVIAILLQMCDALIAAHAAGVIHRDLKTDNVFLTDTGVKLLDWGIAKEMSADARATLDGVVVGTPQYLAPEQARGGEITDKSDVYALGVVAHELFLEQLPFEAETSVEIMAMHLRNAPPLPRELWPDIPLALEDLLLVMLAKDPEHRPTMFEVARRLEAIRDAMTARRAPTAPTTIPHVPAPAEPPVRRTRAWQWALGVASLGALAAMFAITRARDSAADHQSGQPFAPIAAAARVAPIAIATPMPVPAIAQAPAVAKPTPAVARTPRARAAPERAGPQATRERERERQRTPDDDRPGRRVRRRARRLAPRATQSVGRAGATHRRAARSGATGARARPRRHARRVPMRGTAGLGLVVLVVATTARADDEVPAKARALAERGRADHDRGDYGAAIAEFTEAYALAPSPALLFNLAQAYRLAGRCDDAALMYRRYLTGDPAPGRPRALPARRGPPRRAVRAARADADPGAADARARRRRRRGDRRRARARDRRGVRVSRLHRRRPGQHGVRTRRELGVDPRCRRERPARRDRGAGARRPRRGRGGERHRAVRARRPHPGDRDHTAHRRGGGPRVVAVLTRVLALAPLAACYTPDLRDCTVTCTAADDCAGDEVCGPQGLCAAQGVACRPPTVAVHVAIDGMGTVAIAGSTTCMSAADHVDCVLIAPSDGDVMLQAMPPPHFTAWSGACGGAGHAPSCTLAPAAVIVVGATFDMGDDP